MWIRRFLPMIALAAALASGPPARADLHYRAEITGVEDAALSSLLVL
jgi:hypothetical protein